jgi:hypothetical protein
MLPMAAASAANVRDCLTRDVRGKRSHISAPDRAAFERRLYVTPDDVVRYVFLTNANYDGDRSVAIYHAPAKERSLAGGYWLTATVASDSIDPENAQAVAVRRYDAPLPAGAATAVRALWLAVVERTRDERDTVICSPTGIFSVTTARGRRLSAITTGLDEGGLCLELIRLGSDLVNYPQFAAAKRAEAARKIEEKSRMLLARVVRPSA